MASTAKYVQLARTLPEPLQRFFARWPPASLLQSTTAPAPAPAPASSPQVSPQAQQQQQQQRANPFRCYKHPVTGKWHDPVYSSRRQAQLVQMARAHGVEELLPATNKGTYHRLAHRIEHGLRVKGTGVGQTVKGHIHERHMIAKYGCAQPSPCSCPLPSFFCFFLFPPRCAFP
ncbi:Ribosomal protein of the large subunit [Moelleriella libera RCEF 2490]|uniref:Ribosomal protein of the large subunit n=1 Tax=Moelleriella libera RCEF 2490 TaxID=1081109 RepID=A0A166VJT9_9HYPO|nr:Ribosomal protein of the large subunit [Moelleriella libera RCEF 2490]